MALIDLINIEKRYTMGNEIINALSKVNLQINKNEYLALMGPSGSGKSTLMNILGCLDTPTSGTYILNNQDVSKLKGFVFQTFNLLPKLSALENVMLPMLYAGKNKTEREETAKKVMKHVGLENRMNHKPSELSGGQRQRVAVARSMVNNPSIILADEPTGNLDSKTSIEIMALFKEIHQQGNTIILVTHEEDIANYAQRIVRMKDGAIDDYGLSK